jgi:uncharacterized protein with gpF-like domain
MGRAAMPSLLDWKHQSVTLEGLADPPTEEDARDAAKAFDDVRETHIARADEAMQGVLNEIASDIAESARSVSGATDLEPPIEAAVEATRDTYRSAWESEFERVATDFYRRTFDVLEGKAKRHVYYLKQRRPSEGQPQPPPDQGSRPPLETALAAFIAANIGVLVGVAHQTTKESVLALLRAAMEEGAEKGWSSQQIADAFIEALAGDAFHGDSRARRIARNLVIRASNWGAIEAARAHSGDWLKDWVSQRDSQVRPAHLETDFSGPIPLGDFFDVGGFQAKFPLDPRLPPGQIINCRCILIFVSE